MSLAKPLLRAPAKPTKAEGGDASVAMLLGVGGVLIVVGESSDHDKLYF